MYEQIYTLHIHTQMKHKIYYIYVQISIFVSGKYGGAHDKRMN